MKITNDFTSLEIKLNDETVVDLTTKELLNVIEDNADELDATAKLKAIKMLFKSRGIQTKEDLIVEVTNFLHYAI